MEYAYAALLLNEAEKELNEENITRVLKAAEIDVNSSRVKAMVAALEDIAVDDVVTEMTEQTMEDVEAEPRDNRGETDDEPALSADQDAEAPEDDTPALGEEDE